MKLNLVIIHMDMVMDALELEPGEYTIGRGKANNIVVQHFSLSREQGKIFFEEGQWFYQEASTGRTRTINDSEAITLSPQISLASEEFVENEKTHITDIQSVLSGHRLVLKKRFVKVSALVVGLILFSILGYQIFKTGQYPLDPNNLLTQVRDKVVEFETIRDNQVVADFKKYAGLKDKDFKENSGFCTGFLVATNVVLTASHCLFGTMIIDISNDFLLKTVDGKRHKIKRVLGFDVKRDYLFLETEGMDSYGYLSFAPNYKIGQKVFTVGNVHGEGIAIRDGIMASETPDLNDPDVSFVRYSAGASPGNSGGPLLDEYGRIVALVFASTWTENYNLGTSSEDLKVGFDKFVGSSGAQKKKNIQIEMRKVLNFNAQAMLQALSIPYLTQFDEHPEISQIFNDIKINQEVPFDFDKIDEQLLEKINTEIHKAYINVQKSLEEKDELVLDWKSFVSKKTPAILPSQFDFSQNRFFKKNGRYFPKIAGLIDSPSKTDMTKYIEQLEKEKKFDFQAYGYNIKSTEKAMGLKQGDIFYKPKNKTGMKLRLQDLAQGVPYSTLVIRQGFQIGDEESALAMTQMIQNFLQAPGVLASAISRFVRPKSVKDFTITELDIKGSN